MKTQKETTTTTGLTVKTINALYKKANEVKNSFKNACVVLLELAATDGDAKRLCAYLGLTSESLKKDKISETRKNILNKLPTYYMIPGSETHFPAQLVAVNALQKRAGLTGYIAKEQSYLRALLEVGRIISCATEYTSICVELVSYDTTAEVYTSENVHCTTYNKDGSKIGEKNTEYARYRNAIKEANAAGRFERAAQLQKAL